MAPKGTRQPQTAYPHFTAEMKWRKKLGQMLRTAREELGLNTTEAGELIGVSGGAVSNAELANRSDALTSLTLLFNLCAELRVQANFPNGRPKILKAKPNHLDFTDKECQMVLLVRESPELLRALVNARIKRLQELIS